MNIILFKTQKRKLLTSLGEFYWFVFTCLRLLFKKPYRYQLFWQQCQVAGWDSIPIIILVSLFTGMVFALQTTYAFRLFSAETLVGATVGLSLTREIAPVFSALMITARVGSAMAAEIGTMNVSEQIDALKAMAVNPVHYLVVPRLLALALMLPLQTMIFDVVGFGGAYLVAVGLFDIPQGPFIYRLEQMLEVGDVFGGLFKAFVFGILIALITTYNGLKAQQGARGVGVATTKAVVQASVLVLITDYFLAQILLELF